MPQVYLLLDGAAANAPKYDSVDAPSGRSGGREVERSPRPGIDTPPKPNPRTYPHEAAGWEMKYDPIISKGHGLSHAQIDAKVAQWIAEDAANG